MPKKYEKPDQYEALRLYEQYDRNVSAVSRHDGMPSRRLLYAWRDEGLPLDATGGDDWDTYLDKRNKQSVQRAQSAETQKERDVQQFYSEQRGRIGKMLDHIYRGVLDGEVEIKGKDFSKLLADYMTLDNRKADQIEWARETFRKMLQAVHAEVDDNAFERIKTAFIGIEKDQREKLGQLPNKRKFTGEIE